MKNILRIFFGFVKTYPAILYSIFLIIFLPLFLYLNTFFILKKFEKNVDFILQKKAIFLQSVISEFASNFLKNQEILQEKIEKISQDNPEVKFLRILKKEGDEFKILCSQKKEEIGAILEDPTLFLSWSQNQTIASLILINENQKERVWKIVAPFSDNGEKIGLISFALSLKETDALLERSIFNALLAMIFGILFSLFLIIQHTNLFGYVETTKKLKEIDKAKDEFIRMASHELQAPIANIRGYLEDLKERMKTRLLPEEKEDFERIDLSAKNLVNLVSDILTVSRLEGQRLDFSTEKLSVNKEIEEAVLEFSPRVKEKKLKLSISLPEEEVFIKANKWRFREIITNLVSNAVKYTLEGEIKVEVKVDKKTKRCYISVIDSGIGISAEAQQRLFQKFFREKKKETAEIPGTGLGLWITKEIVEKIGGKIFVESIEGKGSKFFFYLPLA